MRPAAAPQDRRTGRDQPAPEQRPGQRPRQPPRQPQRSDAYWLYGSHAVRAALANPRRRLLRVLHTVEAAGLVESLPPETLRRAAGTAFERTDRAALARLLPAGAVHQGLAARVEPLPPVELDALCRRLAPEDEPTVLLLDQVTDPHNVGAILRSAAAFGAAAVILPERNAAPESGALAKAASGALEHVPLIRVANLARSIDGLKQAGFWCVGLAAEATEPLAEADLSGRIALALGSEGGGLRRLTRERCDLVLRLPTSGPFGDLNVSNAAAVALYERVRNRSAAGGVPRGRSRRA